MPEHTLYLSDDDEVSVMQSILGSFQVVPDLDYAEPEYLRLTDLDSYFQARKQTRHFFLLIAGLIESPLEMRGITKPQGKVFYISPRSGGPTLQFLASGSFVEHGTHYFRPGGISFYPSYWSTTTGVSLRTPSTIASAYRSVRKSLAAVCLTAKADSSIIGIGKDAYRQLQSGAKLVGCGTITIDATEIARLEASTRGGKGHKARICVLYPSLVDPIITSATRNRHPRRASK